MSDRSTLLKDISEMVAAGVADDLSSDEIAGNVMVIIETDELLANSSPVPTSAQGATQASVPPHDTDLYEIAVAAWESQTSHPYYTDAINAVIEAVTAALTQTACCKGLAPAWECRCEIERKNAGHPPYHRGAVTEGDRAGPYADPITAEEYFRGTLKVIAHWAEVDLSNEWESGLRGIIRSITDAARETLSAHPPSQHPSTQSLRQDG